jgi:hypothetical protein
LHGIFLCINHLWRGLSPVRLPKPLAVAVTFISVMIAWVFFRADSAATALHILSCMTGKYGVALQDTQSLLASAVRAIGIEVQDVGISRLLRINEKWFILWAALAAVFFAPSAHQLMKGALALDVTAVAAGAAKPHLLWRPSAAWAAVIALMAIVSALLLTRVNAFIYFQF